MGKGIRLEYSNGKIEWLNTSSMKNRSEFLYNDFFQYKFQQIRKLKKTKSDLQGKFYCACSDREKLELFIHKFPKKERYGLRVADGTAQKHKENCLFFNLDGAEQLIDEEGSYSPLMFSSVKTNKQNEEILEKENNRITTFNNFCYDLIIYANIYANNKKNYFLAKSNNTENLYNKLKMPTFKEFCFSIVGIAKDKENNLSFKNNTIFEAIKKEEKSLHFGIVEEEIFSEKYRDSHVHHTYGKTRIINLKINSFYSSKAEFKNTSLQVSEDILKNASSLIKSKSESGYLKSPYFVFAITDDFTDFKNNKFSKKVTRLFVQAIDFESLDSPYCFIEKSEERILSRRYIKEDMFFIKPISNLEYDRFNSKITTLISSERQKFRFNNRPDYIIFNSSDGVNYISLVELSRFDDAKYLNNLKEKMMRYKEDIKEQKVNVNIRIEIY